MSAEEASKDAGTGATRVGFLAARTAALLLCTCGVPLLTIGLVHWLYGVPISAFRPLINDEVVYWHQALTFSHVGFNGGYYTLNEATNPSGFTPFGPHGAGFPVLYGFVGALFGWHRHDVLVLNLLAIGAAGWLWVAWTRLTPGRLLTSVLLLLTFWPMVFWAASGMQEGLHHAGAIGFAALFARALQGRPSRRLALTGWAALVLFSYIRPSWTVLMPLWALATAVAPSARGIAARLAGSAFIAVLVIVAFSRSAAPVPNTFFLMDDLATAARTVLNGVQVNVERGLQVTGYTELEVLNRIQYISWLVASSVGAAVLAWTSRLRGERMPTHLSIAAVAIVLIVVLLFLFYAVTNWTEHRIVSAFVLFGALVCTAAPGRLPTLLAALLVFSNVVTTALFVRGFEAGHRDQFIWDRHGVSQLEYALAEHVDYRTDQPRWCNTLLTAQYPPYLIAVPAGIGLSVVREPDRVAMPPRSRYLLLDQPALAEFTAPLNVKALVTLPYGTLYENLDARCEADGVR
jgi:hypothetical protein